MATSRRKPAVGQSAPEFCLPDHRGRELCLRDARGHWLILFFYPRDMTPGCTQEACDFRDAYRALRRRKTVVWGLSTDLAESHRKFRAEYKLPYPLLVDEDARVCRLYGVWRRKINFGRRYMGIERSTFIIDPTGRVAQVWRGLKVDGHVDLVTRFIEAPADP